MQFDTYFGFFAQSVHTALAGSLAAQTGQKVELDALHLGTTNTIKLRLGEVETVLVPRLTQAPDVPFVLALAEGDRAALLRLVGGSGARLQQVMEQAAAAAVEPFNFISKGRNQLSGLQFSRNVTGLTAHHLGGEVAYTQATGHYTVPRGPGFALRLLVAAEGRDRIEDRVTQASTQRAIFAINEGAYTCRPQWAPPEPPAGMERGEALSESMLNAWLQTFFGRNGALTTNRLFQRPVGLHCALSNAEAFTGLAERDGPPTVVRLQAGESKARELFVMLPASVATQLMRLSRSGQERFLGDMFRVLLADSARLWEAFAEQPVRWRLLAVRQVSQETVTALAKRAEDGGLLVRQVSRMDEGYLEWMLVVGAHTWRWLLWLTARGMGHTGEGAPDRSAIFGATGWGHGRVPWRKLLPPLEGPDLQDLVRALQQVRVDEGTCAAVAATLDESTRERWLEALPVRLRERSEAYELTREDAVRRLKGLTRTLVGLNRNGKVPESRLALWLTLYSEYEWGYAQHVMDRLLPLRHLVYGMDRGSLTRLLFDVKNDVVTDLLCWAEFPVLDQIRRAISPGFAVRLLEDVGVRRPRCSAYAAQQAQLNLYRACHAGLGEGRYMLRPTPAQRLQEVLRLIDDEPPPAPAEQGEQPP